MKNIIFKGCGTAIITPFTNDGINFDEFEKLINFQINNGADSIIVCGTTGESSTMTLEEKRLQLSLLLKLLIKEFLLLQELVVIVQNLQLSLQGLQPMLALMLA